jgi:hypothetical protein
MPSLLDHSTPENHARDLFARDPGNNGAASPLADAFLLKNLNNSTDQASAIWRAKA